MDFQDAIQSIMQADRNELDKFERLIGENRPLENHVLFAGVAAGCRELRDTVP